MGDQDDGGTGPVQAGDQLHQRLRVPPVLAGGGLVENEDPRGADEHRRDREPLSLSPAEPQRMGPGGVAQPHLAEHSPDAFRHLLLRYVCIAQAEGGLVEDGVREDLVVGILEDEPHLARQVTGVAAPGVTAAHPHHSRSGAQESGEMPGQSAFACTVAAQQRDELAAIDGEIHAVECQRPRGVPVGQGDRLQDWCAGGRLRRGAARGLRRSGPGAGRRP